VSAATIVGIVALLAVPGVRPAFAFCDYFNFELAGSEVVPPSGSEGWGASELHLCEDDSLRGYLFLLTESPVTAVHIHGPAQPGSNGPILFQVPLPDSGEHVPILLGSLTIEQKAWLGSERCYIDVHTVRFPDGEIRGQITHEIAVGQRPWSAVKRLFR
jgi:hypothetical protein